MRFLAAIPALLASLLLAAHFFRQEQLAIAILCCVLPLLLLIPRARRLVQLALLAGSLEWLWTMVKITEIRAQMGGSTTRMMIILCGVSAFTLLSGLLVSVMIRPKNVVA